MSSLTGQQIKDTYQSLLKTDDNGLITTVYKGITDGSGSVSGLYLKADGVYVSGSLVVNGGTIYSQFLNNETSGTTIISAHQNIINHGDLVVRSTDVFIIEETAQYLILGELINSGSIIVSGSLIANQGISGNGSISGPGVILNNNVIVAYNKANKSYGFPQLDGEGMISSSQYLEPFSKNTTDTTSSNTVRAYQNIFNHDNLIVQVNDIFIIEKNAEYYMLGDLTNNGAVIVSGSLTVDGIINLHGPLILASGSGIIL
jgi:hypothetical protein